MSSFNISHTLTNGNIDVVIVALTGATTTVSSITDNGSSGGSAYYFRNASSVTGTRVEIWSTTHAGITGSPTTITVNLSGVSRIEGISGQYSGVAGLGGTVATTGKTIGPGTNQASATANGFQVAAFSASGTSTFSAVSGNLRTSVVGTTIGAALVDNTNATAGATMNNGVNLTVIEDWAAISLDLQANATWTAGGRLVEAAAGVEPTLGQPLAVVFETPNTAGNLIVVGVSAANANATYTISDLKGNSYSTAIGPASDGGNTYQSMIFYAANIAAGTNSVKVTETGGGGRLRILIHEFSGAATSSPLDQTSSSTGSGTALDSGSKTTLQNNEMIFGFGAVSVASVFSAGTNFTTRVNVNNGSSASVGSEDRVVTSAASYSAPMTINPTGTWVMLMATFKDPAQGGSPAGIQVSSRSDILSNSQPSATSNHTIAFTLNNSLVTQGSSVTNTLTVTFPSGFSLANVTCGDVDVATATQFLLNVSGDGAQTNCPNTATSWGMLIDSTNRIMTLTTPSSTNQYVYVASGTKMTITIGSNATSQNQGAHWITNPSSAGVYTISVGGTFGGSGNMLVSINSAVTVAATVAESLSLTVSPSATSVAYQKSDQGYCNGNTAAGNMSGVCDNVNTKTFTYTPQQGNDGVLIAVGCAATTTPSSVTLSGSGWTFTQVGSILGSVGASGWFALFKAYAPNTSQVTITQTWNGLGVNLCGNGSKGFMNDLVDEWKGMDPTNFVDAVGTLSNGSSGCTANVTPNAANDGLDGLCNDTVTGVGGGYTNGANDTQGDWSEYTVLSGGAGVSQTVNFTSSGAANEFAVAIKPAPNCTADDGATVNQIATTATSVPFGFISPNTFYQGCQDLIVSTNAGNGYSLTVQESSTMKTANGQFTIPDTTCDNGGCTMLQRLPGSLPPITGLDIHALINQAVIAMLRTRTARNSSRCRT